MKKTLTIIYIILFVIAIFVLQMFVIDSRELFGVKPNLILICVIVVSLWFGVYTGSVTDILFGNGIGLFTISYSIVGVLVGLFSNNYRKESKVALVCVTCISTAIFELVEYIMCFATTNTYTSILYFLYQVAITSILNIIIVYIVHSLLYKLILFFENGLDIYDM